jgi:putative transposase
MTMARSQIVDVSVTRWYHCMTRCVRRAFLLSEDEGEGAFDRKG